jgi:peroxiredoxin Q/BCP
MEPSSSFVVKKDRVSIPAWQTPSLLFPGAILREVDPELSVLPHDRCAYLASALRIIEPPKKEQAMAKKDNAPIGPTMGETIPSLPIKLHDGEERTLLSLAGEHGVVIAFVRSLDWCPFCKKQVRLLDELQEEINATGWTLTSLSYDQPEALAKFAEANSIKHTLLSDAGSRVIDAFNLRNTRVKPGGRSVGVPHPAIVFLSKDGSVKGVVRENGYQVRPSAAEVLAEAKRLGS